MGMFTKRYKLSKIWNTLWNLEENSQEQRKLLKAVREFGTYITANRTFIPNYGDRYRHGETISTGFVESAINQIVSKRMLKKQQMRWTDRGAHLLLQVRTRVLNEEWRSTLSHWYPVWRCASDPLSHAPTLPDRTLWRPAQAPP